MPPWLPSVDSTWRVLFVFERSEFVKRLAECLCVLCDLGPCAGIAEIDPAKVALFGNVLANRRHRVSRPAEAMHANQDRGGNPWEIGLPADGVECLAADVVRAHLGDSVGGIEQTELSGFDVALNSPLVTHEVIRPVLQTTQSRASVFLYCHNWVRYVFNLAEQGGECCVPDEVGGVTGNVSRTLACTGKSGTGAVTGTRSQIQTLPEH